MDIVFVVQYLSGKCNPEKSTSRFFYLAERLKDAGVDKIEIITSQFIHGSKTTATNIPKEYYGIKITALDEPGYLNNVSLKRFYSHSILAKNLKQYLNTRKKPDIIYIAVPSLSVAEVAINYCEQNNIRSIIDIQDLWPEAFKMIVNIPPFTNIIYAPMKKQANKIYSKSDNVVAVSETYLNRAMQVNNKCNNPLMIYLGKEKDIFDKYVLETDDFRNEILGWKDETVKIAYCGTLGYSYDIPLVIKALKQLSPKELDEIQVIIMGDGPKRTEFENMSVGMPVIYTGSLAYERMVKLLSMCDITINPIVKGAAQSITNKQMDYAFSGLPVINTQESEEYRNMVNKYNCGINCRCGNSNDVVDAIRKLLTDKELRLTMGRNHRTVGEELFDRKTTYKRLIDLILDK